MKSKMDGISLLLVGSIGLSEEESGAFWARGGPGAKIRIEPLSDKTYFGRVELDEEVIVAAQGKTPADVCAALTISLEDLSSAINSILAEDDEGA